LSREPAIAAAAPECARTAPASAALSPTSPVRSMTVGATSSRLASLRHHSSFGHELAVAASTHAVVQHRGSPGWELNDRDTRATTLFLVLAGVCWVLTALVLAVSAVIYRMRSKEAIGVPTPGGPRLIADQPAWRQAFLIFIGLSPLILCFCVGEYYENVVVVMVLMHNGCMILLPSLYYAFRSYAEPASREVTSEFYSKFWQRQIREAVFKVLRGIYFGFPVFFLLLSGYFAFNCRTSKWFLCVHRFEKGLEEHGLKHHSLAFRCIGLLYFTFINPLYEEFFWRVFLHRELGVARFMIVEETLSAASQGVEAPGAGLPDSSQPRIMSVETCTEVMDLVPPEEIVEDITESEETAHWSHGEAAKGAFHELIDRMKVGYNCYRYALSFGTAEEEPGMRAALWQSIALRWGVSLMYGAYHMWPIQVIFRGSVCYALGGWLFLTMMGRGFLLLRECQHFGIITATVVHIWVDAAFSAICLYEF